jgi:hypothetical protein
MSVEPLDNVHSSALQSTTSVDGMCRLVDCWMHEKVIAVKGE